VVRTSNWPVALLASAYLPEEHSQEMLMAICVGYFEPRVASNPATLTVSGYVSEKKRWRAFEEKWPRALRSEGITAFRGVDFITNTGEFSSGWSEDDARRTRLIGLLTRVTQQHVARAVSCSMRLEDYQAINRTYNLSETVGGPYSVCAAYVMCGIRDWLARYRPDDLALFIFEDGEIDHRCIRRILTAEGIDRGEPPQFWPRQWKDEQGRHRFLRPLEACDLLMPGCSSGIADCLKQRGSWDDEVIDRKRLMALCKTLSVTLRTS
jgi:hypothetical protein